MVHSLPLLRGHEVRLKSNYRFYPSLTYGNSGLWVVLPAYMTAVFGSDLVQALDVASGAADEKEE